MRWYFVYYRVDLLRNLNVLHNYHMLDLNQKYLRLLYWILVLQRSYKIIVVCPSLCVCPSVSYLFLRNGSLVFLIGILKNWQPFFQENSFLPRFGRKGHQSKSFWIFFFLSLVFQGNNQKWKLMLLIISTSIPYLAEFWFLSYGQKCCWPINMQDSLKCNVSRNRWLMKFIFSVQISIS